MFHARSEQYGDEGHFSTSKVNIHIHLGQEGCIQYVEIHCGKVTGCGKVGPSTLGFGSFAGTRLPSFHGQQEIFVEMALGNFPDVHARFRANGTRRKSTELRHVEFDVAGRKLLPQKHCPEVNRFSASRSCLESKMKMKG